MRRMVCYVPSAPPVTHTTRPPIAMDTIRKIVLARDFSPSSVPALRHAVHMATTYEAELHILYANVLHADPFGGTHAAERTDADIQQRMKEETEEKLTFDNVDVEALSITYHVQRDVAPGPAILTFADEHEMDLIVLGTHGRRGLRRMLLGSVAEEVVRLASAPVITVPAHSRNTLPFRSILVPIDFSDHSQKTLEVAKGLAKRHDTALTLMHVVEDHLPPSFYTGSVFSAQREEASLLEKTRKELAQFAEETNGPDGLEMTFVAESGHAADRITQYAATQDIDLVLLATHGRTGLARFALGSVAEKVLRNVSCPVLTRKAFPEATRKRREEDMAAARDA